MRIKQVEVENYGPLRDLIWNPPEVGVVYDDNMAGKTALVDILVRHLFISREGSSLFRNYHRFDDTKSSGISLEIEDSGSSYLFGSGADEVNLKDLFGWTEEGLFRLLCIRGGDNRLVTGNRERSSVFNGAASLVAGVGTDKLNRIDRDLREEFRLTSRNNWSNRKTTRPPKVKDRIEEDILPFLEDFSKAEKYLRRFEERKYEIGELEDALEELEGRKEKLEKRLELIRAERLKSHLSKIERLESEMEDYGRIFPEDEKTWRTAREKLERNRRKLSEEDYRGDRPEEKLKSITEEIESKEDLLENEIENMIRSKRERRRELEEKVASIKQVAKEERRNASLYLQEKIRSPLKRLASLEDERNRLRFWAKNRIWIGTASAILVISGITGGLVISLPVGLSSLFGLGLLLITLKRAGRHEDLSREIEELEKKITRSFNSEFKELFERTIREPGEVEQAIEEVPRRVEESVEREKNLFELVHEKRSLEAELKELNEEQDQLPEEIEKLKSDRDSLEEEISEARQEIREAKRTLADLRDRTNLPDLTSLREELEEKEKLKRKLRDEKAILKRELGVKSLKEEELPFRAEKKVKELTEDIEKAEIDLNGTITDTEEAETEISGELEGMEEKIKRKEGELREKRKELQGLEADLSGLGVDPEDPAELFRKKLDKEEELNEFIRDRIAGSIAREAVQDVGSSYLESLHRYISGETVERTVEDLFTEVMGNRFEVGFDSETNEFMIEEDGLSYPEGDLSSGGRKHLFLSTRLALINRITSKPAFLILDDPFLFYQRKRKKRAIQQLRPFVEEGWQVLIFTVDDQTRDGAIRALDAEEFSVQDMTK